MSLQWIITPVSKQAPSGPDLWEDDDAAFSDYYFNSVGRLPEADDYVRPGMFNGTDKTPDVIFDPKSVKLDTELTTIDALLKRSRDLRLLALRAQWAILAGNLTICVQSVQAIADLLEAMPETAHPVISGSPRDRLEAINDLSQIGAMILPLRYLDLAASGASVRRFMVARGDATAMDGETDFTIETLSEALASSGPSLDLLHGDLIGFKAALKRIEMACLGHDTPHTPQFATLRSEIDATLDVVVAARPDISPGPDTDTDTGTEAAPDGAGKTDTGTAAPATAAIRVPVVASQDEARARLQAVEVYFSQHEPSSATLLLVTQARVLIGKSLIDAFDILMPDAAQRATVGFSGDPDFRLSHDQLLGLAGQVSLGAGNADESTDGTEPPAPDEGGDFPPPTTAPEASAHLKAVETYFHTAEKSSPVPILLSRARAFIGKDFQALMKEFIPPYD